MKFLGGIEEGTAIQKLIFGVIGISLVLLVWIFLTMGADPILTSGIMPTPMRVLTAFPDLFNDNELLRNTGLSLGLNLAGYVEAIALAIPIGFLIGLIKYPRWGFQRLVDAIRYVPLTAVTGLFIVWFGIGASMKVHFLAFGILIYLLPIIVQRIDEVDDVFLKTVHTLGATDWQTVRTVYIPSVLSRISDDIRVLTAISWTYIIVAEGIGSQGGIGDLIWKAGLRQGRVDKVFALLIIIMAIGVIQDKVFVMLDKALFPFKYQAKESIKSSRLGQKGLVRSLADFAMTAFGWILMSIYFVLMINEYTSFLGDFKPLSYLFGQTMWVFHFMFASILFYKGYHWYEHRTDQLALQAITTKSTKA